MEKTPVVAVVGASGALGHELLDILNSRQFPAAKVLAFEVGDDCDGETVSFGDDELDVQPLNEKSFDGAELAFFVADKSTAQHFAPHAQASDCTVLDASDAWRNDDRCPLVIPELNADILEHHNGIIVSPHPSVIPLAMVLKPLHDEAVIKRVVVSTYQAVSENGQPGIDELEGQIRQLFAMQDAESSVYPCQIAFNCFPQTEEFIENDDTREEIATGNEIRKLFGNPDIKVTATCVRVPCFYGDSASVNIEFAHPLEDTECRAILAQTDGVRVLDNPQSSIYPNATDVVGLDEVCVGRIRRDLTVDHGVNLWIATDNLRKGSALNMVQTAEELLRRNVLHGNNRGMFLQS